MKYAAICEKSIPLLTEDDEGFMVFDSDHGADDRLPVSVTVQIQKASQESPLSASMGDFLTHLYRYAADHDRLLFVGQDADSDITTEDRLQSMKKNGGCSMRLEHLDALSAEMGNQGVVPPRGFQSRYVLIAHPHVSADLLREDGEHSTLWESVATSAGEATQSDTVVLFEEGAITPVCTEERVAVYPSYLIGHNAVGAFSGNSSVMILNDRSFLVVLSSTLSSA